MDIEKNPQDPKSEEVELAEDPNATIQESSIEQSDADFEDKHFKEGTTHRENEKKPEGPEHDEQSIPVESASEKHEQEDVISDDSGSGDEALKQEVSNKRENVKERQETYEQRARKKQDKRSQERIQELQGRQITLYQVELERFRDQRELFVPPPSFNELTRQLSDEKRRQIVLVIGTKNSGKQTFAINLADWILENKLERRTSKSVWFFTDRRHDQILLNIIYDSNLQENSVVIIEEAVDLGLLSEELDLGPIDLDEILRPRNVYVILTASVTDAREIYSAPRDYLIGTTDEVDMERVLEGYIDFFFDKDFFPEKHKKLSELLQNEQRKAAIITNHDTPSKLWIYFRRLKDSPEGFDGLGIEAEIQSLRTKSAIAWFESLRPLNFRLYALMAVLFDNLETQSFDALYFEVVRFLREQEGLNEHDQFVDPRQIGLSELRMRTALVESGPVLEFEEEFYQRIVYEQIENHFWLLWSVCKYLVEFFQTLREAENPRYRSYEERRRIRDIIARALATTGIFYRPELKKLLAEIVVHQESFVVVTASSILEFISETGKHNEFIIEVLDKWVKSKDYDQIWAACVTIGRLYRRHSNKRTSTAKHSTSGDLPSLMNNLEKSLTYVSEHFRDQQRNREILQESVSTELIATFGKPQPEEVEDFERLVRDLTERQMELMANDIRIALVGAVNELAISFPDRALKLLERWITSEKTHHHYEHARMALNFIWLESRKLPGVFLEQYAYPLMEFLPPTLEASKGVTVGTVFHFLSIMTKWSRMESDERRYHNEVSKLIRQEPITNATGAILSWHAAALQADKASSDRNNGVNVKGSAPERGDKLWEETVRLRLLDLCTQLTRPERLLLTASILQAWQTAEKKQISVLRTIQAVMTRAHVLNGEATLLPSLGMKGIVIVDGMATLSDESFFLPILQFIRSLAGLLPLEIYRLGDVRQRFSLTGANTDRNGKLTTITLQDLRYIGQERPPLLMPIIIDFEQSLLAKEIAFLIVFNGRPITDIQDFLPDQNGLPPTKMVRENPLMMDYLKEVGNEIHEPINEQLTNWEQSGRLFFFNPPRVSDQTHRQIIEIQSDLLGLQQHLSDIIASTLMEIPTAVLQAGLQDHVESLQWRDNLSERLNAWLTYLEYSDSHAHQVIDIVQAISVSCLLEARVGKQGIYTLIEGWLEKGPSETTARAVSIAVVRTLFRVFLNSSETSEEQVDRVLQLLPKFSVATDDAQELLPIIEELIWWSNNGVRTSYLRNSSNLTTCIKSLESSELQILVEWSYRYDFLALYADIFTEFNHEFGMFRKLVDQLRNYCKENGHSEIPKEMEFTRHVSNEKLTQLVESFQVRDGPGENGELYEWLLLAVSRLEGALVHEKAPTIPETIDFVVAAATHFRMEALQYLRGTIPHIDADSYYGVVLVDAASREVLDLTEKLIPVFADNRPKNVSLILHHLGNPAIIQQVDEENEFRKGKGFGLDPIRLAVLGPTLVRYVTQQEQIAFVLVITQSRVIDFEDWTEMQESVWPYRMSVILTGGHWKPTRGELAHFSDEASMHELVERLYARV